MLYLTYKDNVLKLPIMPILKKTKDAFFKFILGETIVPRGLSELNHYFRVYGPINFKNKKEGNVIVATSTNFRYGSIITFGKNPEELDKKVKDAILTSFEVPSSYAKEADIRRTEEKKEEYAFS